MWPMLPEGLMGLGVIRDPNWFGAKFPTGEPGSEFDDGLLLAVPSPASPGVKQAAYGTKRSKAGTWEP
jgi:hypothetical protein